jgi:organic radical activating enzyme
MIKLEQSGKLHHAMVEVTTSCQMRCVYCAVSGENWKPQTLDPEKYDQIIENLIQLKTKSVILHGHGETTIIENWDLIAQKFIDAGFQLSICTNLSKNYTDKEFAILSKFNQITVSLDTINPTTFKQLRRGGDIRHIIYNMMRIKAINNNIKWIWSSVACDKSIWSLLDLINFGISLGVGTFCLCNLTIEPGVTLKHLSELEKNEAEKALAILDKIEALCLERGVEFDIKSGLIDTLKKVVYGEIHNTPKRRIYSLMP